MTSKTIPPSAPPPRRGAHLVFVPIALLATAATLFWGPWGFRSPVAAATTVPAWVTNPAPIRPAKMRPELTTAGFTYRCSDCHRHIDSPPETTRTLTQHRNIVLNHGLNARCFNCHNPTDRDTFVDNAGQPIPFDQPQLLCAKCHGPVYRDWLHGAHGRTNGYWHAARGPQSRRRCIECHDPHTPPFPPMKPAPAPNTLRMGPQDEPHHPEGVPNPLRLPSAGGAAEEDRH